VSTVAAGKREAAIAVVREIARRCRANAERHRQNAQYTDSAQTRSYDEEQATKCEAEAAALELLIDEKGKVTA